MADNERPPCRLVICCDGTNNTLTAGTEDTNVLQFYTHLRQNAALQYLLYYDPGVGTPDAAPPTDPIDWGSRTWKRVAGLASGRGVYDKIAEAYLFLMRHWRDNGDRIYCFGFSRGAFTVRCIVGMVNLFGILAPEHESMVPTLVGIYFSLPNDRRGWFLQRATRWLHRATARQEPAAAEVGGHNQAAAGHVTRQGLADQVRALFTSPAGREAEVHWVGVWDTVESVGLPGPLSRSNPSTATLRGKRVRNVRHALAFDEHRWTFEPRLYDEPGDIHDAGQSLEQRWFPGVHCDVGGSYPMATAGLPEAALEWMIGGVASDLGVPPLPPRHLKRVRHDALWDTPWWALAGMCLRNMRPQTGDGTPIAVIPATMVSADTETVWDHRRAAWPILVAVLLGIVFVSLSGACVSEAGWPRWGDAGAWPHAHWWAGQFARDQLASLTGYGLLDPARWAKWKALEPGWAMFWDFAFIGCWGYMLARIASRAFAWMAGWRDEKSGAPLWRWLGMAPLLAVGSDVCEDLLTLAALALDGMHAGPLPVVCLWLAGVASAGKLAGLIACLPLVAVRLWIAMPWVERFRRS